VNADSDGVCVMVCVITRRFDAHRKGLAAPPDLTSSFNAQPSVSMAASTSFFLSVVCDKLHRKREAERYRRGALMLLPTH